MGFDLDLGIENKVPKRFELWMKFKTLDELLDEEWCFLKPVMESFCAFNCSQLF